MIFSHFHAENNKKKKALHKRKISKLNNVGYIEKNKQARHKADNAT